MHTGRQAFIYIKSTFLTEKAMLKPGPGCSCNSSTLELEDQDLKVIFSHTVNLKLIWATRNPIKKKKEIRLGWVVIPLFSALKSQKQISGCLWSDSVSKRVCGVCNPIDEWGDNTDVDDIQGLTCARHTLPTEQYPQP